MMSLSSDSASVSTSSALAKHRYNQALDLEKQLRTLLQVKGPFDSNVRALQNSVREKYEAVILEDHELAEQHEVEQAIWRLHYKQIDEFRARIKKINLSAAAPPVPGSKAPPPRESIHKVLAAFKSFLAEATAFYHDLIVKLRAKHGIPQDIFAFRGIEASSTGVNEKNRWSEVKRCQLSCHRCLIFLGDLARYKEVHGNVQDSRNIEFSVSAGYYIQAALLWPSSGNPHNQLAVLATYINDELLAVYRYFRSLAVETPFLTARDNLILLFEKNRVNYSQLNSLKSVVSSTGPNTGVGLKSSGNGNGGRGDRMHPVGNGAVKFAKKEGKSENSDVKGNATSVSELRKSFHIRFVRMNGILFTRTSLETFPEVYSETVSELKQLLAADDSMLEASLGVDHRSAKSMGSTGPTNVLQLVAILIFTVHNINWSPDATNHHPTYAEILQRSDLCGHALTAAFEFGAYLMRRCSDSKEPIRSSLLPALLLLMEWLAGRPEMAVGSEIDKKQGIARSFFWAECLTLLNSFIRIHKEQGNLNSELEMVSSGGLGMGDNDRGVALSEDFELQGFIPLAPAQMALDYTRGGSLDYSRGGSGEGMGDKDLKVRVQRLLAAGKAVANALESSKRGICFDEEEEKFYLAGEGKVENNEEKVLVAELEDDIVKAEEESDEEEEEGASVQSTPLSSKSSWPLGTSIVEKPATPRVKVTHEEEEDEEVIVFKPMVRERQGPPLLPPEPSFSDNLAPAPSFNFPALATPDVFAPGITSLNTSIESPWVSEVSGQVPSVSVASNFRTYNQISQGSVQKTSGGSSYLLDSSTVIAASKPGPAELAIPLPLMSSSVRVSSPIVAPIPETSNPLTTMSLPGLNPLFKELSVAGSHELPIMTSPVTRAGDWLEQQSGPAPRYASSNLESWMQGQRSIFVNGPDKTLSTSQVLGLSNQGDVHTSLWSSQLEPNMYSSGLSSHNPLGGEGPLVSNSLPPLSASELSASPELGKYPTSSNRDSASAMTSSWSGKESSFPNRGSQPAMRPPPGFGPLPGKSTGRPSAVISQGIIQPPTAHLPSQRHTEGDDQVDDYGWLDDFRTPKPVTSQSGYPGERDFFSYSNNRNMWSTGDGNIRSSGFESSPFPFPGMGAPHRKINTSAPQFQPPYNENQQVYSAERQRLIDKAHAQSQGRAQAELHQLHQQHQQHQQLLLLDRQQQQQQQQWAGQFHSCDPFVS